MPDVVIKEELFQLNQGHFTMANGTVSVWSENGRYQVPVDRKYIFRPGHTFSAAFNNGTSSPAADGTANPPKLAGDYLNTARVRIEVRDPSENTRIHLLQDSVYGLCRHFADRDLIRRLDISEMVEALSGYWIVISTLPTTAALDATDADTYFQLYCDIVRQTIM